MREGNTYNPPTHSNLHLMQIGKSVRKNGPPLTAIEIRILRKHISRRINLTYMPDIMSVSKQKYAFVSCIVIYSGEKAVEILVSFQNIRLRKQLTFSRQTGVIKS